VSKRQFGISTHLYHGQRLCRDHLLEIAAHGFEWLEVYATRTHFDYHNPAAVADLQQWLAEAGLQLRSIHAPTAEGFTGGRWSGSLSLASPDPEARAKAVSETEKALHIARRIPAAVLVAHLGVPRTQPRDARVGAHDSRAAARRSIEELVGAARRTDRTGTDSERAVAGRLDRALRRGRSRPGRHLPGLRARAP
jgi:sugar phosphate isomerase/epimerase